MKKTILFSIDSLECAGAEKSLTTLLKLIDYSKYDVDLMMFAHGGTLQDLVPKEVTILKPLKYSEFTELTLKRSLIYSMKKYHFKMITARIKFSLIIRKFNYSNVEKAREFWKCTSDVIESNPKEYDIGISYAQGIPTFYVAEKIKAKKKIAWVNTSYILSDEDKNFQRKYYDKYHNIIAVSHSAKNILIGTFPEYEEKIGVIYDINNPEFILEMAKVNKGYDDGFDGIRLLTIGRLAEGKDYFTAMEACKKLKEKGIKFKWYALGEGSLKESLEIYIKENKITEDFVFLGLKTNPYPFIKNCDIYVQTSKFEGFGLAIAEARMLNKPVVTTNFDSV
ncbi:MAG: glycosyltransferase, partial [Clostridium sp.]